MIKVGITGNMGSGKSVVCEMFKLLGVPVYNSDQVSKSILNTNQKLVSELVSVFGKKIVDNYNSIDKKKFAEVLFENSEHVKKANKIIHPFVISNYNQWLDKHKDYNITILESAILYESKNDHLVDVIIVVRAPESVKIDRIVNRDQMGKKQILRRMKNQMSDEIQASRADYIIYNTGKEFVTKQVIEIYNKILNHDKTR